MALMLALAGIVIGTSGWRIGRGSAAAVAVWRAFGRAMWRHFGRPSALCLLMTLAGSLIPAMRAVRIDPMTAIRTE